MNCFVRLGIKVWKYWVQVLESLEKMFNLYIWCSVVFREIFLYWSNNMEVESQEVCFVNVYMCEYLYVNVLDRSVWRDFEVGSLLEIKFRSLGVS